jgi:hypothetical protein
VERKQSYTTLAVLATIAALNVRELGQMAHSDAFHSMPRDDAARRRIARAAKKHAQVSYLPIEACTACSLSVGYHQLNVLAVLLVFGSGTQRCKAIR